MKCVGERREHREGQWISVGKERGEEQRNPHAKDRIIQLSDRKPKVDRDLSKIKVYLSHTLNAGKADQGCSCGSTMISDQTESSVPPLCHPQQAVSMLWLRIVALTSIFTSAL